MIVGSSEKGVAVFLPLPMMIFQKKIVHYLYILFNFLDYFL